ncbi:MAG: sigma 54-interacting transcriptional regulator [Gammaproteobacteria bacterium]|nr:sigma 54-interacting transcriptional regulator [Gammaproteobacteria bacterium]
MKIIKQPDIRITVFQNIITVAPCMLEFFQLIERVARTDTSLLIRGETGTGKELAAQAVHNLSPRAKGPWQAVNCATLGSDLLASELFGHVKGAFTGASADKKGLFELANKGSLFLDEIGEMSIDVQARLLRVLQERVFTPVGATQTRATDVRVISATHRALREEVEEGRFREDLMYRLRVVKLFLPPLRERKGDVEALTWRFIEEFNQQGFREVNSIEQDAYDALISYHWPGNIRELRNAIEGAFAIGIGDILLLDDLPPELRGEIDIDEKPSTQGGMSEKQQIQMALKQSKGKKGKAAELMGISRATLWRKMREYQLI